eukprot:2352544-Rhodomonas_salina.1
MKLDKMLKALAVCFPIPLGHGAWCPSADKHALANLDLSGQSRAGPGAWRGDGCNEPGCQHERVWGISAGTLLLRKNKM